MAKLATSLIIAGTFLIATALDEFALKIAGSSRTVLVMGIILLIIGLNMLHKKVRLF